MIADENDWVPLSFTNVVKFENVPFPYPGSIWIKLFSESIIIMSVWLSWLISAVVTYDGKESVPIVYIHCCLNVPSP